MLKETMKALSAGGAVLLSMANPVNLLFLVLLFVAGFALFTEQILLVGFISTLALLTAAIGAAVLAALLVGSGMILSLRGFSISLGAVFVTTLAIWSLEIFNTVPNNPWLFVLALAGIMLICSLFLVPRLRAVYRAKGIMASE